LVIGNVCSHTPVIRSVHPYSTGLVAHFSSAFIPFYRFYRLLFSSSTHVHLSHVIDRSRLAIFTWLLHVGHYLAGDWKFLRLIIGGFSGSIANLCWAGCTHQRSVHASRWFWFPSAVILVVFPISGMSVSWFCHFAGAPSPYLGSRDTTIQWTCPVDPNSESEFPRSSSPSTLSGIRW
jgi:hypothetical protein